MRPLVIAFALGALAVGALAVAAALAAGVVAEANDWNEVRIAVGSLLFVAFEREGRTTATTLGSGLLAIALLAGVLNAVGAALLRRPGRARGS